MMNQIKYTFILLMLLLVSTLSAQTLKEAKEMLNNGEYEQPKEFFRKQVASRPNDATLNHYYGLCLYHTGEKDKAVAYFTKAAKKNIQNSYLYLGMINYENYNFTEAKNQFSKYIEALEENKGDVAKGERLYDKASRAESMLRRTEKVVIIDSMIVAKENFLDNYKLSFECGSLAYFSDMFDDADSIGGTLYKNQREDKVIYASMSDSIYSIKERTKLNDGSWSEEVLVDVMPGISGNVAYPFLLNDGLTIYYATDNDSLSIGGYDIFVTRKNLNSDEFLSPNNMGMPYNSIANDYMMVIDEFYNIGWFATDRNQPADSVAIYLFIPNEQKDMFDNELSEIIPYARITDIKKTWTEGADYDKLLNTIYNQPAKSYKEDKSDFVFIITPGLKYTQYSQFKSPKALELFKLSQSVEQEISELQTSLRRMRREYAENPSRQTILEHAILKSEDYIKTLYPQPEQYRNASREEELKELTKGK